MRIVSQMDRALDEETRELYNNARSKNADDATKEEIIAMIKCALYGANKKSFEYIEEYEYTLNRSWTETKKCVKFQNKKIVVSLGRYSSLGSSNNSIQEYFWGDDDKIEYGVNAENVYPYALEMLFNGEVPNSKIQVLDHFVDGNLAYIHTKVKRRLEKRNKHGYSYVEREREMVIEKWGKNGENIKVKSKKFIEDFKILMQQMRAPKAKVIEVIEKKVVETHNTQPAKIKERDNRESYVQLSTQFSFVNKFYLSSIQHAWVRYTNGSVVWVGVRKDYYENNEIQSNYLGDKYFKLNEFGGLIEVEENPIIFTELIDEKETEPEVIPYVEHFDLYLKTSEDETEIINNFENHPYMKAELTKETPHAREYVLTNYINEKSYMVHFVKYDDIWIHSNQGNKKVQQMIEVYALAEQLSDDEDEVV